MDDVKIIFTQTQMELFVKDLLSLNKGGIWSRHIANSQLLISTKGSSKELQKIIYDWLSVPKRKQFFEGEE